MPVSTVFSLEVRPVIWDNTNVLRPFSWTDPPELFVMSPKQLRGNAFSIVAAAVVATACRSSAQPPPPETASQQKSSPEARTAADQRSKPQIIYNLGSASREMAEVLHSQSKPADNSLPVDP